jgi:hypothetical protein
MRRLLFVIFTGSVLFLWGCSKKEGTEAAAPQAEAQQAPGGGPHATVQLKDGTKVPGVIVASTQTEMVVAGDDGIERKIPLTQVKGVEYGEAPVARKTAAPRPGQPAARSLAPQPAAGQPAPPPVPAAMSKTNVLPAGTELSVRTNETIDSGKAAEGQTFDAQVTRDVRDADGDLVIPRGSDAAIVIKSATKGGRFKGASDLVLDLTAVNIEGRRYAIDATDLEKKGKSGVGANRRTATYAGGGAALGAIIGAIAGGGKGAAIGAGAGAGAGVLTEVITKGGSIKVPAETVLTFKLDQPLRVAAQ